MTRGPRDLVMGITPFHEPGADLVVAVARAGYLGVLDLGPDAASAGDALDRVRRRLRGRPFGVRISAQPAASARPTAPPLPAEVDTVVVDPVLSPGTLSDPFLRAGAARVITEVTCPQEAAEALRLGADGLVARGLEAGGRIGELSTFVLIQRLVVAHPGVPVWAAGGIGPRTAAAAVAGGARGVVLDTQLALTAEADLPPEVAAAIAAMDGSETRLVPRALAVPAAGAGSSGSFRVYARPDLPDVQPGDGRFGPRGLREQLLPIGQDGGFAAPLAARYKTAGGVASAIADAIASQVELAARAAPLQSATPVQGPMTRVSDRAEFAAAVAADGGLPFLALALMRGDQAAALLTETKHQLADKPWGAGILGFAPPALREAQLKAILEARPPYAVIAGGRPAQARELEAAGIETFLHVPSPGLLRQFLSSGARKFVFEGAECGGHIGPRASFALWEAQLDVLDEQPDLSDVAVWFAGGVHDERSAAMVAAMAAPLTARGAKISVLMGTAYLFTKEIVASGAVVPLYQEAARQTAATALLETSPGHVIRVADTPYVGAFAAAKRELNDAGAPPQRAWAELEQLSLGRLRIAAKGLRREGDTVAAVDEQTAKDDGMFMLGQVAAMRREVTTVRTLHEQVTRGATEFLAGRAAELRDQVRQAGDGEDRNRARPLDVAIVGMACCYPGADGLGAFWANIVGGTDSITDVPPERWQRDTYPDVPAAKGGFVPPIAFDALEFGIPPSALASIEPAQLLSLEIAARALKDAGYSDRPFGRDRTSVIFGTEPGSDLSAAYGLRSVLPTYTGKVPEDLDEHLPKLTEDSFPGVLGNVISGRIANRLDLGGVNYTVDAACASSLTALDLACKELVNGTSDMVLCGGADTHNGIGDYEMFASVHALSAEGRCATFDSTADGIALGEGVACVVLKRLADAERDGDRIYAVVKSVAGSSDGRSLGLTAPRPEGQRRALERAYAQAGVSPNEVGLIEAHGTGTVAGDRAELATLTTMFTEHGAAPGSCVIGSVKSQIGHTKCAAGLAGLIKVASALHTGTRPGTLHLTEPTGYWDPGTSPFTFTSRPNGPGGGTGANARPWPAPPEKRYAGVSAFGFGGTNFHTVLAGYDGADEPPHGLREWPAELIVFRGDPGAAVTHLRDLIAENDAAGRPWTLAEVAATMAARSGPVTAAFVADDLDDLAAKARRPPPGRSPAGPGLTDAGEPGQVAFLFPGQGSQRPGMAGDVLVAFPRLQRLLRLGDRRYAEVMFPPTAFTKQDRDQQAAAIADTRMAQPALGIADSVLHELLTMVGIQPDMAAGHSYGELVALRAAGVFGDTELLNLSAIRGQAILDAAGDDPGAMAAVSAPAGQVAAALAETGTGVVIANYNSPQQSVISGPTRAVDEAVTRLAAGGLSAKRVNVACAFHSPLVADAAGTLAEALANMDVASPRFPVFANSTAAPYPDSPDEVRRVLAGQVAEPVRFAEQIEAMYTAGARVFIEAGPGRVLSGLVRKILGDRPGTVVACDVPGEHGLSRFLTALAELINAGVAVDPVPLFAKRAAPVAGPPRRAQWTVDGHLVRTADGQPVAGGLRPATEAPRVALNASTSGASPEVRDEVVTEFLRTTRELVSAQRDVVLGYLGATPAPAPAPVPLATKPHDEPERIAPSPQRPAPAPPARPTEDEAPDRRAAPASREEIGAAVTAVISARTGYPADMLGADLDLEADLSVDSIKRTEIIAALADRLGLGTDGGAESVIGELAALKTIDGLTSWLTSHVGAGDPGSAEPEVNDSPVPGAWLRPGRFTVEPVDLAAPHADMPAQGRYLIVDDGRGIALELAELLEKHGSEAVTTDAPSKAELAEADSLVHLGALRPGGRPVLPGGFEAIREAVVGGARAVLIATGGRLETGQDTGDAAGLGLSGLMRTIAAEYPAILARAVDVEPKDSPRVIAEQLLSELADPSGPPVTGYRGGQRVAPQIRELAALAPPEDLGLEPSSVVLITGGARGITARAALAIARSARCHIELVGRSAAPSGAEDPDTVGVTDPAELRKILIGRGLTSPREIEAAARRVLRMREMRATLDGLRAAAASVRYHAVDVRDGAAVAAVMADVYARHDRIDGVLHGAGILEDHLMPDKTPESFARVYATKVDGARALLAGLRPDAKFVGLFSSVSGVFGNRGQADYSAANDALDTLARQWSGRLPGRVFAVDWGPWGGTGMVSPELAREYTRRGIALIDPAEGVSCLLAEIAADAGPAQVIYLCGEVPGA